MQRARRHRLALHGELEQFDLGERPGQQRIRRHQRGHRRGRRSPQAAAERNALVDGRGETEAGIQHLLHREQRAARGVLLRIARDVGDHAGRARDDDAGLVRAFERHGITQHIH